MKRTKTTFLFAATLSLIGAGAQAQTAKTLYVGDSLPTTQGWVEWKLDASINPAAAPVTQAVANGALKFTSVNGVDTFSQLGWYQANPGLDLSKGYTIELKAKLNVATKGSFNIQGYDNSGKGFRVTIADTFLTNQSDPVAATTLIASGLTNDANFHVYRLAAKPSGEVDVYRDVTKIGTFALGAFQFDNIITNGGFEDEEFPDFRSNGILRRISKEDDYKKVSTGNYSLEMDNNGLVTNGWTNIENARTRDIAIKPNTPYELRITRRRTASEPWCWRDGGAFYNGQRGTLDGVDERGTNITWLGFDRIWQTHPQDFTTPDMDDDHQSVRLEFPTWTREDVKNFNTTGFDNVILREKPTLTILPTATPATFNPEPAFHDGYVNLIQNGGFEDDTLNNDGTRYEWALSDTNRQDGNDPYANNPLWHTGKVRIQRSSQNNDFNDGDRDGRNYAHSGTSSLRFTTDWNNTEARDDKNFDFSVELDANKTYRFAFWMRSPKWDDKGWLFVKIGEGDPVWGHLLSGRNNVWSLVDLTFTTTEENKILHLYSGQHGDWFNLYLDDLVLYEIPAGTPLDPQIAGKTNLIANGDFEDVTKNNDGSDYDWALASQRESSDDDFPMAYNEIWGTWLRIQDKEKRGSDQWGDRDDTGYDWAHSGTKSIRFTYQDNWGNGQSFEGVSADTLPDAYKLNMNFKKELEPNKTYTFVFWIKTSCWNDKGWFHIANGDIKILSQELNNRYMSWTRQSITFSTTAADHTLRMFTEFGGWFNFYLDDLFLYEEDAYQPDLATYNGNSYLFFGKSQNTASADVEVEYVKYFPGAYAPGVEKFVPLTLHYALTETTDTTISGDFDVTVADLTLPVPEREYYTFVGWYTNAGFEGDAVTTIPQGATEAKEYWGLWQLSSSEFTITYHTNGGDAIPDSSYTVESETVVLPAASGKNGYTFAGWYANGDLTGDVVTEVTSGSIGNKNFYAKWEAISYTITYHVGDVVADSSYTIEDAVTFPSPIGYTYEWYDNAGFTGDAVTGLAVGNTGNKEFWAKVTPFTYTIVYHPNSGNPIPDGSYTIESATITLPEAVREDYTFKGWYSNNTFTGEAVTEIPRGSTGNKEYWAKWEKNASTAVSALDASVLRIYPNPVVSGLLAIDNLSGSGKVEIYSMSGALVASYSVAGEQAVIDISALPAGTYIVKAGSKTAKILKE